MRQHRSFFYNLAGSLHQFAVLTAFQGLFRALCFDNKISEWYSKFALNGGTKRMSWFDRTTGSKKTLEPQSEKVSEALKSTLDPAPTAAIARKAEPALPKIEAPPKPADPGPVAYLYKDSRVTGQLSFQGAARIDGSVDGEIQCQGTLTIGEGADIRAKVSGRVVILRGKVEGNVTAKERLELIAPARLIGNVDTPRLLVTEGVVFDGNCAMGTTKQKGGLTSLGVSADKPAAAQITKLQADSNS